MPLTARTVDEALAFARRESADRSRDWTRYCQAFVRSCWGLPAFYGSARAQWLGAAGADKHEGGSPDDAPVGAALCWASSPSGHITLAGRRAEDGTWGSWSTDIKRRGWPDWCPRDAPRSQWGQPYLGFLTSVNGYDLKLEEKDAVPELQEPVRYLQVQKAGDRLAQALATAQRRGDSDDAEVLTRELARLRRIYARLEKER
jgi:hypothetical protein